LINFIYKLQNIDFEWNVEKAERNLKNHGISFQTACQVFFDPFLHVEDAGSVEEEKREAVLGLTLNWKFLYVVYVMRDDTIRIISAREATAQERIRYENL
jgi:uncharacterized DUF497 family protein